MNLQIETKDQALKLKDKQMEMQQHQFGQEKSIIEAKLEKELTAQLDALEMAQRQEAELKAKNGQIDQVVQEKVALESQLKDLQTQIQANTQQLNLQK